jgi:hypothetical protein
VEADAVRWFGDMGEWAQQIQVPPILKEQHDALVKWRGEATKASEQNEQDYHTYKYTQKTSLLAVLCKVCSDILPLPSLKIHF